VARHCFASRWNVTSPHDRRDRYSGLLDFARAVLEHQRTFRQVRSGSTRFCCQIGSHAGVAGLCAFPCSLDLSIWPGRDTAFSCFAVNRSSNLCAGALRCDLVAENTRHRVEPRCGVEAGAQASGTWPLQIYAPSHLHRPSAHGSGNGHSFGIGCCICGASIIRGRFLDKT
jgi:hypothetical protein